jgi:hypothetical protein
MGNMQNILQNGELAAGTMHKKRNMHQAARNGAKNFSGLSCLNWQSCRKRL